MTVVSVSMPDALLERLDEFVDEHGYTGRSEVIRDASRKLLDEFEDESLEDRPLMGVITVLFNYEQSDIEQEMTHLRHDHEELIVSNVHSHVGDHVCLELFILEGDLDHISNFVGKIRATQDILTVDYSIIPVDEYSPRLQP